VFSSSPWHGQDYLEEGDTWDDLDPEYDPMNTTVPAWTVVGALVYKSLLDSYGPKPLPAFDPGYVLQSARLYNAAVGLAEIGITQQVSRPKSTPMPTSEEPPKVKSYQQWWEYGETFSWAIATAAAIAVAGIIGGGPKGRSQGRYGRSGMGTPGVGYNFSMAKNPAFAFMYGQNPLRSVTTDVYSQLVGGYVPVGARVIKEKDTAAAGMGKTFLSNPADRGRFAAYGY